MHTPDLGRGGAGQRQDASQVGIGAAAEADAAQHGIDHD